MSKATITLLGVRIDKDDLYVKINVRGCDHALPDIEAFFCPICGKPILVEKVVPREGYEHGELFGFFVVTYFSYAYVGMLINRIEYGQLTGGYQFKHLPDLDALRGRLKEVLGDKYFEVVFGFHSLDVKDT